MERKNELFRELAQIDVNNYIEQKNGAATEISYPQPME